MYIKDSNSADSLTLSILKLSIFLSPYFKLLKNKSINSELEHQLIIIRCVINESIISFTISNSKLMFIFNNFFVYELIIILYLTDVNKKVAKYLSFLIKRRIIDNYYRFC